jgi:DNA-binding XRE family transcriptional regulator
MNFYLLVSVINSDISKAVFGSKKEAQMEMGRRFAKAQGIPKSRVPALLSGKAADLLQGSEFGEDYATVTENGTNYDWHIFDITEDIACLKQSHKTSGKAKEEPGVRLAEFRKAAGLTQKQLAEAVGIHISQLQKAEYGISDTQNMVAKTVLRIAEVLDVDPYDLI